MKRMTSAIVAAPVILGGCAHRLVINRFGNQICKQDAFRTVDRQSGILTGVVFLLDFVPYRRR